MRVIALVNTARPPSVGSFSRSSMTTRLCAAVESAERQSHCTVQLSGTFTWSSPARAPLMSGPAGPGVTTRAMVMVLAASSETSQAGRDESGLEAAGAAAGGGGALVLWAEAQAVDAASAPRIPSTPR